jgi:hypothetical protein
VATVSHRALGNDRDVGDHAAGLRDGPAGQGRHLPAKQPAPHHHRLRECSLSSLTQLPSTGPHGQNSPPVAKDARPRPDALTPAFCHLPSRWSGASACCFPLLSLTRCLHSECLPHRVSPMRRLSHPTSSHGQQSAAKGSLTTVSRSDIRSIQYLDSSALGSVRRWRLIGYFPFHLLPHRRISLISLFLTHDAHHGDSPTASPCAHTGTHGQRTLHASLATLSRCSPTLTARRPPHAGAETAAERMDWSGSAAAAHRRWWQALGRTWLCAAPPRASSPSRPAPLAAAARCCNQVRGFAATGFPYR